jgi:hypothetical protein
MDTKKKLVIGYQYQMKCNSKHFKWGTGSHGYDPCPGDVTTPLMDRKETYRRLKVTIMCKNHAFPPPSVIVWGSSRSVLAIPLQQEHTSAHLRDETFVQLLGNHKKNSLKTCYG